MPTSGFMARHLFLHAGGAVPSAGTMALRQHVDAPDANSVTLSSVLAGSMILLMSVRGKTLTNSTFTTAGFTKIDDTDANGTANDPIDSGCGTIWAKIATGGETTITVDAGSSCSYICAYEITGAGAIAAITKISASNAGTGSTSDLGSLTSAVGLAFALHIATRAEAGVHSNSGVTAGDFTETHDRYMTFTSGNPDDSFFWMGTATGTGGSLHAAVTNSGSPAMVNTGGIAIVVPPSSPF